MAKHLPPKKSKHLKEPEPRQNFSAKAERSAHSDDISERLSKKNLLLGALSLCLFIAACFIPTEDPWLQLIFFAVPYIVLAVPVFVRAAGFAAALNLLEDDIIVSIASLAAFGIGQFAAGALIMLLYTAARMLEALGEKRQKKLQCGMKIELPELAITETDKGFEEKPVQELAQGDVVIVKAGEIIPVDGVVLEGMSSLDSSPLTASDEAVVASVGGEVVSGCRNITSDIKVLVNRIYTESAAYVANEQRERSARYNTKHEKFVSGFVKYYVPVITAAALLAAVLPPIFNREWREWIGRAVVLLALSGCFGLEISVELSYLRGVAVLAGKGIVAKGYRFLESLAGTKTVIFNKTRTLTEGRYTVSEVVPKDISGEELLAAAAQAEKLSSHPIARAICRAGSGFIADDSTRIKMEEIPGRGVSSIVGDRHVFVGNAALLEEHGIHCAIAKKGGAAIHVALNGVYCGYILVNDRIRSGAFDALEALRVQGVKNMVMLTADSRSVARPIASSLNLDMVKAELTEEAKTSAVEYLNATKPEKSSLTFVSDGSGEAEALGRADVGIATGSLGDIEALDCADIIIMDDDIRLVPETLRISKNVCFTAGVSIILTIAAKLLLSALALFGKLSIIPAVSIDFAIFAITLLGAFRADSFGVNIKRRRKK
ncbi:MAG: HAD-IC family P-type ATPase [Candidatus Limivicinus sp.]|jgi:Cd2+/Zn2+-exporting ATPase